MRLRSAIMTLLLAGLGLGLSGCYYAPGYGYGYDSGYYGAPAYYGGPAYYGPSVGVYYGGYYGGGWRRDRWR